MNNTKESQQLFSFPSTQECREIPYHPNNKDKSVHNLSMMSEQLGSFEGKVKEDLISMTGTYIKLLKSSIEEKAILRGQGLPNDKNEVEDILIKRSIRLWRCLESLACQGNNTGLANARLRVMGGYWQNFCAIEDVSKVAVRNVEEKFKDPR